jgi:hypothetical protein
MSKFISLDQAVAMTTLYRQQKETVLAPPFKGQDILCISETIERSFFESLLANPECMKLRIYYGMDKELKIHAIIVGVNKSNEDILPAKVAGKLLDPGSGIIDEAQRCPTDCAPPSPLNP